jgi:hypothetical protein
MDRHITVVAALHIGLSIIGLFFTLIAYTVLLGRSVAQYIEPDAMMILSVVLPILTGFMVLIFAGSLLGGIGLMFHKNWARILILIIASMDLINVPFGTAVAIYTFWVLLQAETTALFTGAEKT